jgi:hypothetical protein
VGTELAEREKLSLRQLYRRVAGARGTGWSSEQRAAAVVELLIPELPWRGLFRVSADGTTPRENLGLARPASRYAQRDVSAAE